MSKEKVSDREIVLALVGLAVAVVSLLTAVAEQGYLPWILRGAAVLLIIIFLVARRAVYRSANIIAGNYISSQYLRTLADAGKPMTKEQKRFVARLDHPWWRNWYWLIAGGRKLAEPSGS